ncbi:uncharacterized protein LOC133532688 isoform X2 [Cydia pomonella]|nr:uncharacterized protein LOC133532688 isoform X2 [Cydia pomonella]XP_061727441.1 uncharacterized protein LOC133532688 isoform X2 [Cydia pomonella]
MNPDAITIFHLCYAMSYIWRRGRKGIHRYYNFRDTYHNHMLFEIGYITQTIMAKYQNVLELYELSTRMEPGKRIGRPHLFFFYKNILEDCRTIIHLCNMIHEVTRKYRTQQYSARGQTWLPVPYDPAAKFMDYAGNEYVKEFAVTDRRSTRKREYGVEGFEHDKIVHEDKAMYERIKSVGLLELKQKQREYQAIKKQKDFFLDHGFFSMTNPSATRRTKRWRSNEPMIYGWEPTES